jgi:hypothetical protein
MTDIIDTDSKFWKTTFGRVVAGVIAGNAGLLVSGLVVDGHEQLFETAHNAILGFFCVTRSTWCG